MMRFSELGSRVARERIDMVQLWNAWSETESLRRHSFLGSMNWETRNARHYLYRRRVGVAKSLGPRSVETEEIFAAFTEGKRANAERLRALNEEIRVQASVLRALGAGRLPLMAARTLRALQSHRTDSIRTVGTNALYAYEALAGVTFSRDSTATGDLDLLVDDRNRLQLVSEDGKRTGLGSLIQKKVDRTFRPRGPGDFRLINDQGYMVEFIRPQSRPMHRRMPGAEPLEKGDVEPAPIFGLQWLVNAPAVETMVLDERGFPVPMKAPDPRYWALHKSWLSNRLDRASLMRSRDRQQSELVMRLVQEHLPHLPFDGEWMAGMPKELRRLVPEKGSDDSIEPPW
ncbi:MAG: nucleotidyltransferase domain-containing protein [Alphaproteobacteria bacterium]|nr:nucleotidyltransferase domain-containing protein [Alphaproteobacteria bacterium]